jgi:acetyl esterase/lipase
MGRDVLTRRPPPGEQRIPYGEDPSQFGHLRTPPGPGPHPVVVYLHGGCWLSEYDLDHAAHACAALTDAGVATWSLEYRRIGASGGGWPATFNDVARGADHLRELAAEKRLDLSRVIAAGHSAGGHLAAWLAARPGIPAGDPLHTPDPLAIRGVVSIAGLIDLARASELRLCGGSMDLLIGGTPKAVPDRYAIASPYELLPLGVPQVLMSGGRDTIVPAGIAERYAARAKERGDTVETVTLENADHFDLIDPLTPAFARVREAVLALLR